MMINDVFNHGQMCYVPLTFSKPSSVVTSTESSIEVYPNPATDVLNVIVKNIGRSEKYEINISDGLGSILSSTRMNGTSTSIDISVLLPGIYTVKVNDKSQTVLITKFIKIK